MQMRGSSFDDERRAHGVAADIAYLGRRLITPPPRPGVLLSVSYTSRLACRTHDTTVI